MYYFAYGSNLYEPRMRHRVPSAIPVAVGRLPGYELAFRKIGNDGSMKCDLDPVEWETAWGMIYYIHPDEVELLDAVEGEGYKRVEELVTRSDGASAVDAITYRARAEWIGEGHPFDWYRDLIVTGARRHGLPEPYVAAIESLDAIEDPDPDRRAAARP